VAVQADIPNCNFATGASFSRLGRQACLNCRRQPTNISTAASSAPKAVDS